MKKIFFAAVFAGALLGFTSCGNREMVTDPEMETAERIYHSFEIRRLPSVDELRTDG